MDKNKRGPRQDAEINSGGAREQGHGIMTPRILTASDIPECMRLKESAGWNQTEQDWRNVMALAPEGCLRIEECGAVVATTTAVCFGQELGWIGMVLTDPAYRGRGYARCLMQEALAQLSARRVRWIKLDATDMGRPLYEQLGFRTEGLIERWLRPPGAVLPPCTAPGPFRLDVALDREAFGADRSELLEVLAKMETATLESGAYAMGRPGSKAHYFGPCVSRSREHARDLLTWFLGQHQREPVYWDVLSANSEAVDLAREHGFEKVRTLSRMSLDSVADTPRLDNHDELVFAAAGFEYG